MYAFSIISREVEGEKKEVGREIGKGEREGGREGDREGRERLKFILKIGGKVYVK